MLPKMAFQGFRDTEIPVGYERPFKLPTSGISGELLGASHGDGSAVCGVQNMPCAREITFPQSIGNLPLEFPACYWIMRLSAGRHGFWRWRLNCRGRARYGLNQIPGRSGGECRKFPPSHGQFENDIPTHVSPILLSGWAAGGVQPLIPYTETAEEIIPFHRYGGLWICRLGAGR